MDAAPGRRLERVALPYGTRAMRGIIGEVHLVAASDVPSDRRRGQRVSIAEHVDPGVLVPQDPVVGDRRRTIRITSIEIDAVAPIVSQLVAGDRRRPWAGPSEHSRWGCAVASTILRSWRSSEPHTGRSLDHLIRPQQERRRDRQAEGFGGLEVDDELKRRRFFDGQVTGSSALENLVHEGGGTPV